ncbi:pentapeptide repeat-containing protein [Dietzia sp. SL131]|uniref:pentapeptide repeat-containing protein n=1 Tax=Dietzia sp. SL131 TaxID=2995149 RepID=UPI003FA3888F
MVLGALVGVDHPPDPEPEHDGQTDEDDREQSTHEVPGEDAHTPAGPADQHRPQAGHEEGRHQHQRGVLAGRRRELTVGLHPVLLTIGLHPVRLLRPVGVLGAVEGLRAVLTRVELPAGLRAPVRRGAVLRGSVLRGAVLRGAVLRGAVLLTAVAAGPVLLPAEPRAVTGPLLVLPATDRVVGPARGVAVIRSIHGPTVTLSHDNPLRRQPGTPRARTAPIRCAADLRGRSAHSSRGWAAGMDHSGRASRGSSRAPGRGGRGFFRAAL